MVESDANPYLRHWLNVGALGLLGVLAGIAAQIATAWRFGTGVQLDAFYIALLLATYFPIVYQTAVADPFVPAYVSSGSSRHFATAVLALTLAGGAAAGLALFLNREALVSWSSPGFTPAQATMAQRDIVALALVPMFYATGLWLTSLLASQGRFAVARAAAMIVPLCQCTGVLMGESLWGASPLAWSSTLGYFVYAFVLWAQAGFLSPLDARLGDLGSPAMRRLLVVGTPMTVTIAAGTLHSFIDRSMLSQLGVGNISILTYAERLNGILCTVFLIPITFVALPHFSSSANRPEFGTVYFANVRAALLLFIPVAVFAGGLSFELVDVSLRRGSFAEADVTRVGAAFSAYMIGIPFYAVATLTGRAFIALGKTWILAILAPLALLLKLLLNTLLIGRYDVTGAALSTSLGYIVFSFVTLMLLVHGAGLRGLTREIPTVAVAWAAAAAAFLVADYALTQYSPDTSVLTRAAIVGEAAILFSMIYGGILVMYFFARRRLPQPGCATKGDVEVEN